MPSNGRRLRRRAPATSRGQNRAECGKRRGGRRRAGLQRLFVSIAGLGSELPPLQRLRTIYPRYAETRASAGPGGLAILPFRAGTPYDGQDLVYFGTDPEQFFALCTRAGRMVPGTCIHERILGNAEVTFRFPRDWFGDWRAIAAGFDRLITQLHPQGN